MSGIQVIEHKCVGCEKCQEVCAYDAIDIVAGLAVIDEDKCTLCGACVDICPTALLKVGDAMRRLEPLSEQVQPLFITVDTKRDTPEVLRDYAKYFHPAMIGLTGTQVEVESVASQYRAPVLVRKPDENGYYVVDHSSKLFLVDRDGVLANILNFEVSADDIAGRLKELLEQ